MKSKGFLNGIRVVEIANELGEYCGKLLAGLGAEVIKVEPPSGEVTRNYSPFVNGRGADLESSLFFWHYNYGKKSVTIDFEDPIGCSDFEKLLSTADVLLDSRPLGYLADRGFDESTLDQRFPSLIHAKISPFGDSGPWAGYRGSDLVHLALGGVMMNCGYDPAEDGQYTTPPIAPQMMHAYQIAGEMSAMGILSALHERLSSGEGDRVSVSVHEAVSMNTETDVPNWLFLRQRQLRQTCRHSRPTISPPTLSITKDKRWMLPYRTYLRNDIESFKGTLRMLQHHGAQQDLDDPRYLETDYRSKLEVGTHICDVVDDFIRTYDYGDDVWRMAQDYGLAWAPVRQPHENVEDEHFKLRGTFSEHFESELDGKVTHVGARWYCAQVQWANRSVAPKLGANNDEVLSTPWVESGREVDSIARREESFSISSVIEGSRSPVNDETNRAFPLAGVRVIDLSWLLASSGAGRFLAALGAEVIKVEHYSKWDTMRWGIGMLPEGGRAARDAASAPMTGISDEEDPNRSGSFMEINAGKRGISLDLKKTRGRELLLRLISGASIVLEGFSPGTMDRLGLGYDVLTKANPEIVYVQQSGLGQTGLYQRTRMYGPSAAAFSGLTEMSGLSQPSPPAGIGYSYLDWFGAYNVACAALAALYRQRIGGGGCHIDASQVEVGLYLSGTSVLDYAVNGNTWRREGNSCPFKQSAPHGVYPTKGTDRWIAISVFDDEQWTSLTGVLRAADLSSDPRFDSVDTRLANIEILDSSLASLTKTWDGYDLMHKLQRAGVPAGVCQDAEDRCDRDQQLNHLNWLVELPQSSLGSWPVKSIPFHFDRARCDVGGSLARSGPNYGEDNEYVFGTVLEMTSDEIATLVDEGII